MERYRGSLDIKLRIKREREGGREVGEGKQLSCHCHIFGFRGWKLGHTNSAKLPIYERDSRRTLWNQINLCQILPLKKNGSYFYRFPKTNRMEFKQKEPFLWFLSFDVPLSFPFKKRKKRKGKFFSCY